MKQIKVQYKENMLSQQQHSCQLEKKHQKTCWEQVASHADHLLHICTDCLVYVSQQKDSIVGNKELVAIMAKREAVGIGKYECNIHSVCR